MKKLILLLVCFVGCCDDKQIQVEVPTTIKIVSERYVVAETHHRTSYLFISNDRSYTWVDFKDFVKVKPNAEYSAVWKD